jgi:hypothetical protein
VPFLTIRIWQLRDASDATLAFFEVLIGQFTESRNRYRCPQPLSVLGRSGLFGPFHNVLHPDVRRADFCDRDVVIQQTHNVVGSVTWLVQWRSHVRIPHNKSERERDTTCQPRSRRPFHGIRPNFLMISTRARGGAYVQGRSEHAFLDAVIKVDERVARSPLILLGTFHPKLLIRKVQFPYQFREAKLPSRMRSAWCWLGPLRLDVQLSQ